MRAAREARGLGGGTWILLLDDEGGVKISRMRVMMRVADDEGGRCLFQRARERARERV